ncbi:MAG: chemotaxis protein CheX [Verrucomicrobia bacterium]|nr:chemotaxis protein CheX [Verrucomicrobiota bacterium]
MPTVIKVDYINPFIHSMLNVLETMASTKARIGKPFLKTSDEPISDISGSIGLTGDAAGSVIVNFSKDLACQIVSKMLGENHAELDATVRDGVGEIANMVAGGAKGEMQAMNINFSIALPMVTIGRELTHSHPPDVTCVVVPFTTDVGDFTIEIARKTS